jgi:5'-nucleotidase
MSLLSVTDQWLTILHTNDIHSRFEQMPKLAAAIESLSDGLDVSERLIIDCGDHMDRMRIETEGSEGLANIDIMNETGYEAAAPGNNEGLTFTPEVLQHIYAKANFPLICSNLYEAAAGEIPSWIHPYRIVEKGRLNIALIGVTANFADFYKLLGWAATDPIAAVQTWVDKLRPDAHIVIVMSHLGLALDQRLAETIDGIDFIMGGHTHHLLEQPLRIRDTYICAAGKFGEYVGEVKLRYDFDLNRVVEARGRCVAADGYPDSERILRKIAEHKQTAIEKLNQPVTTLNEPLPNEWTVESPLGNLLAEGLRSWTDTEIGLVNAGQLLTGIDSGKVTLRQLLEICPSPINPCRTALTGEQIWRALEEALLPEFIEKPIRGFGFRGHVLGTLCVDGIQVDYDPGGKPYAKIRKIIITDRGPLDKSRIYNVGTIDMFTFRVGYPSLSEGKNTRYFLPEFIRDILREQLLDSEAIRRSRRRRWVKVNTISD